MSKEVKRVNEALKQHPEAWEMFWSVLMLLESKAGTDKAIEILDGVELPRA